MAKPSTTHVIEIETGIGEPAFIPLTMGQELQPISVGKKGMWRIESARVLDVHAFVYFDGSSLFLQSADESASASVDGYRVGKAWTELHAPCNIEIGAARLRFRSLSAAEPPAPEPRLQPNATTQPPPRPAAGTPPNPAPNKGTEEILSFPKQERPFKPGEFATEAPREEHTRVGPVEETPSGLRVGAVPASSKRLPAADNTRMDTPRGNQAGGMAAPVQAIPQNMHPPNLAQPGSMHPGMQGMHPGMQGMHPGMQQPGMQHPGMQGNYGQSMPPGMQQPGMYGPGMQPGMQGGMQPGMQPGMQGGMQPGMQGGAYPMGPGTMLPSGHFNSQTVGQVGGAPPGGANLYVAKYKELSPPKKILVILAPFCLLASAYLILFDDDAPAQPPVAAAHDAGPAMTAAVVPPPVVPPPPVVASGGAAPVQPRCPPNFVPYTVPVNGQIPCVPIGTPMPPASMAAVAPTAPTTAGGAAPPPDTGRPAATAPAASASASTTTANVKTLERQAVDAVAVGDYARAAAYYDMLLQQNPNNRVYAEAARILRAKADAGAP